MKIFHAAILLFALAFWETSPARAGQFLYLASSRDKTIVAYEVNNECGELTKRFSVDRVHSRFHRTRRSCTPR